MVLVVFLFGCHLALSRQASSDLQAQSKTYEDVCIQNLRTINTAQVTYWGGDQTKGFAHKLSELGPTGAGLIEATLASGKKGGYRFRLVPERTTGRQPVRHYIVVASPIRRLTQEQRSFFTDETGVIRFTAENRPATKSDPAIDGSAPSRQ